jgi:hypothetical protein
MKEYILNYKKWADIVIENMLSYPFHSYLCEETQLIIVHHLWVHLTLKLVDYLRIFGYMRDDTTILQREIHDIVI